MSQISSKTITQIAAGGYFSMELNGDNTIYSWGVLMTSDQTTVCCSGDNSNVARNVPTAMTATAYSSKTITAISASYMNAMALATDGTIFVVGDNTNYQTGDGSTTTTTRKTLILSSLPATVTMNTTLNEKYTSIWQGYGFSVARTSIGRFQLWGDMSWGQCGAGVSYDVDNTYLCQLYLFQKNISSVFFSTNNGQSGNNNFYILGTDGCNYPVPQITRSFATNCNTTAYAWGSNTLGQLADRSFTSRLSPITPFNSSLDFNGETLVEVKFGATFAVGLTNAYKIYSWGQSNSSAYLGNQLGSNQNFPSLVKTPLGYSIVSVTCTLYSCIALATDNSMIGWGSTSNGELGATGSNWYLPALITRGKIGHRVITKLESGMSHYTALTLDNKLFSWGDNYLGKCGTNSLDPTSYKTPWNVYQGGNLNGKTVSDLSVGGAQSMVYTADGNIYVWGYLLVIAGSTPTVQGPGDGSGTGTDRAKMAPVSASPAFSTWNKIYATMRAGLYDSMILTTDGSIYMAGDDTYQAVRSIYFFNILV
jgi:alpha-tubulin suppressor-like RCC1 family protein